MKRILLALAGLLAVTLSSCTAGGSAQGSGAVTTSGSGHVSGSGFVRKN
ncbi:MAG TPA: hypothetical protein VHM91_16525 [Verrucomicrobiales bacterium]|jgi:hypothetical protein|nr:hypothetical protein [Verrucomicrobiales bacterium]